MTRKTKPKDLGTRAPKVVGREKELKMLRDALNRRGEKVIYLVAGGGFGKTRLMQELLDMVKEAGPHFYSSGIIDLYHTDTHSSSDVEKTIVEGLDPQGKYFVEYRKKRALFEKLRERGTDPGNLERQREALSEIFVAGCQEMAMKANKLVICFDTVEVLQYESSVIEDMVETVDTRIKNWLLKNLPELRNVLIVFAGRPKERSQGETIDHQARLEADMKRAFGEALEVVELGPFNLKETGEFIDSLKREDEKESEIVPTDYLPVVHLLTQGRPVFLHLVVDLIRVLSPELRTVDQMFDRCMELVGAPEKDERIKAARLEFESTILKDLINEKAVLGAYLSRIGLAPKGIDGEILVEAMGVPKPDAKQLLAELEELSFVKLLKAPVSATRQELHGDRIFLHDEMYRLLTLPGVIPGLRMRERDVSHMLVTNYYNPRIEKLEREIREKPADERISLRERLQKLQVERLYYLLAHDPRHGYEEYKRLSDQANRRRWVGFGMRLLDEFLRFYNVVPERRELFDACGISHEQVVRESAHMWVERLDCWGQYKREVQFARHILDNPETFFIRVNEDVDILGNICAFWTGARAFLHSHEPYVLEEAQIMLKRLPLLVDCTPTQTLARARLSMSIGYQFRLGGQLAQAAKHYVEAKAAFEKLEGYRDELAMLLNNLSLVYANQGRISLALPLAGDALRINEEMGSEYSTGLTLSTLAAIELMRGNYYDAVEDGKDALKLFRELDDPRGVAMSYIKISYAIRKMAKRDLKRPRKIEEARHDLEVAARDLDNALAMTEEKELESTMAVLYAEQGKVNRELGYAVSLLEGTEKGMVFYRRSEEFFKRALEMNLGKVERANVLQDLAEGLFLSGDISAARRQLAEIEKLIGEDYRITPGRHLPGEELPGEYFWPLGKVERLRGDMAFEEGNLEEGLHHYLISYAYFVRFSPDAVEKDTLVDGLYARLRDVEVEKKRELVESMHTGAQQHDVGVDAGPFVKTLKDLLGV